MGLAQGMVAAWSGVELVAPLTGGARNQVLAARRGGQRLVVRRSIRSPAALDWELDLLEHLADHGISVPRLVPTDDGRRHADGVMICEFVDGHPPSRDDDWQGVVEVLTAVHQLTVGWPQRPGFASVGQLLIADTGGDVRLAAMPPEAVEAVRTAWQPVATGVECVSHGDVGSGNVLVDGDRVTLLDWDEARVDVPWLDFAFLPESVTVAVPMDRQTLRTAGVAWEAATCWMPEPEYARRRLAELYLRLAQSR
jgi:Ser/Thr protein kinase RdoA (MazF antagonist)